ncbi:serine/threonine protein kinase [Streptomyces sp. RB6PN25]|uniref:non-specific serine/threonine protein kinase n=1 Tax=Streptomyces humicola TaxID=2953240 RepID=A0ABT1PZY0_9ACTN|nr:serine/threonine-protein kinase [Streptomyces humicola]MCQ4082615.1 serine/threonine protein kinase [Streptomyces humicola]
MTDQGRLVAGRYRLAELIGRGGMGTVWRAQDELLGRQVAVKKLRVSPHLHDDERETLYERTRREARSAARITHPNVVVVHDVVEDEGLPCIVMEYVRSRTLGDVLKEDGPITPREAARIGRGMIAALRAAHRAGVLHRDVKPANVLLGVDDTESEAGTEGDDGWPGGRVVLTDFGIASATGTSTLTRTGELIGSFDYLAPERITGGSPGPASDLWALGATLYQAVEGQAPFHRDTPIETAYAIATDPVEPPQHAGPLAPLIESLLAKDPEQRMTAEQVERLLVSSVETVAAGSSGGGRTAPSWGGSETSTEVVGAQAPQPPPPAEPATTTTTAPVAEPDTPTAPTSSRRRSRRAAAWCGVAVLVAALSVGGYALSRTLGHPSAGSPARKPSTTPSTSPSTAPSPTAPPGYRIDQDPAGFTMAVPAGWTRKVEADGTEVDFVDLAGKADLKVSILDFAGPSPLKHWQDLEPVVKQQSPGYHLLRMNTTTTTVDGVQQPAAIWEYTWQGRVRAYHAIDLDFGQEGGTEYAVYLSAPDAEWSTFEPYWETARKTFRPGH